MKELPKAHDATRLIKRSVVIAGHRTSVSLEDAFWFALHRIAQQRQCTINSLIATVDEERTGNLSSALRVFVLLHHLQKHPDPPPGS